MATGKLWALGLAAAAIMGQAAWGDEAPSSSSWLGRLFQRGKTTSHDDHHHHLHSAAVTQFQASDEQALAQDNYNRRMAACLKLQRIANETNDEALRQKAEMLVPLIWQQYSASTAHLPMSPAAGNPALPSFVPGKEP